MTRTRKQPVRRRIIDIALFGTFLLIGSFLCGNPEIFKITIPIFLILCCLLGSSRYKHGKVKPKTYLELNRERRKKRFSGCGTLATRENILGY
jgi:hypothetical protein